MITHVQFGDKLLSISFIAVFVCSVILALLSNILLNNECIIFGSIIILISMVLLFVARDLDNSNNSKIFNNQTIDDEIEEKEFELEEHKKELEEQTKELEEQKEICGLLSESVDELKKLKEKINKNTEVNVEVIKKDDEVIVIKRKKNKKDIN